MECSHLANRIFQRIFPFSILVKAPTGASQKVATSNMESYNLRTTDAMVRPPRMVPET